MAFFQWSQTAATNGTADASCPFPEGMAPSAVNDGVRGAMARLREFGNDIAGAIVTAGTNVAYTVTSNQGFDTLAHLSGQVIAFSPHATNGATVTLSVDSLGAKPLRKSPGVELQSGVLVQGTPYVALYNNTDGAFYLFGCGAAPGIPLGCGLDFWGSTTPGSAFAFPTGQAISRTTYATLFSLVGTTYGVGDGSTTFNLPDKTGRVSAMQEASATRLTSTYFGGNSTALGAVGGLESTTLTLAQLPTGITSSGSNTITVANGGIGVVTANAILSSGAAGGVNNQLQAASNTVTITSAGPNNINVTSNNTSGAAHRTVQPTIVCNYILRII